MSLLDVATTVTNPALLGQGGLGVADLTRYEPWFGAINEANINLMGGPSRPATSRNLPEYYVGRNLRMLSLVEHQVFYNSDYLTTVVIPLEETEEMHFDWNIWKFNRHLMHATPYMATSRFITSQLNSGSASTVRYGLAIMMEHEFMNTPAGQENYYQNVQSVGRSVNETNNFDVMKSLISANLEPSLLIHRRSFYTAKTLLDLMEYDRNNFALLQKPNGHKAFQILDTDVTERMAFNNGKADTWLAPPKVQYHIQLVPDKNTEVWTAGDAASRRLTTNTYNLPNANGEFGENKVHFIRMFNYDHDQQIDAMSRTREVGSVNSFLPHGSVDVDKYTKQERDIVVYNEDSDAWQLITLGEVLENCMRFKEMPDDVSGFRTLKTGQLDLTDQEFEVDPFFMSVNDTVSSADSVLGPKSQYRPIEVFGQMKFEDLRDNTQADVAKTVARAIGGGKSQPMDLASNVDDLVRMFEDINHNVWANRTELAEWAGLFMGYERLDPATGVNELHTLVAPPVKTITPSMARENGFAAYRTLEYDLSKGFTLIRPNTDAGGSAGAYRNVLEKRGLIGLSNWYGLLAMISNTEPGQDLQRLQSYRNNISKISNQLERFYPGCIVNDKNRTPGHFPVVSRETVYLENTLGVTGFPVWFNLGQSLARINNWRKDASAKTVGGAGGAFKASLLPQVRAIMGQTITEYKRVVSQLVSYTAQAGITDFSGLFPDATVFNSPEFIASVTPTDIEINNQNLKIWQWAMPITFNSTDNFGMESYEHMTRVKFFTKVLNMFDQTAARSLAQSRPVEYVALLAGLYTMLESKRTQLDIQVDPDWLTTHRADVVAKLEETSEIDEVIMSWITKIGHNGLLTYKGDEIQDGLKLLARTYNKELQLARAEDRIFVSKGIAPIYGLIGAITTAFVKSHSVLEITNKLTAGYYPANESNRYVPARVGGRFGADDAPALSTTATAQMNAVTNSNWVRSTLTLSAAQVARLYELEYASSAPFPLVGVSFPDEPETIASPSDMASFVDGYKKFQTSDYESLSKNKLAGLMLQNDRRLQYIEFTDLYGSYLPFMDENRDQLTSGSGIGSIRKRPRELEFASAPNNRYETPIDTMATRARKRRKPDGGLGYDAQSLIDDELGFGKDRSRKQPVNPGLGKNIPLLTKALINHWSNVHMSNNNSLVKSLIRCLLLTPFSLECLLGLYDNNCTVPVGALLLGPHEAYKTLLLIKVQAGGETGKMMVGHRDFQIGNNMKTKVFFGHFTMNTCPVIYRPENIFIAYDVMVDKALGGAGCRIWNEQNIQFYKPETGDTIHADKFCVLVSYHEEQNQIARGAVANPIDASGRFGYMTAPGLIDRDLYQALHYSTAGWYNAEIQFRPKDLHRRPSPGIMPVSFSHPLHTDPAFRQVGYNTVCWKAAQAHLNPVSRRYDVFVPGAGVWGEGGTGPGSKLVRNGGAAMLPPLEKVIATLHHTA